MSFQQRQSFIFGRLSEGLNGDWGVPMSVPLGHLSEDVGAKVLSETYSQNLEAVTRC